MLRSGSLPGLWLNIVALPSGDRARAAADVQHGVASPKSAAFAADLKRRAAGRST